MGLSLSFSPLAAVLTPTRLSNSVSSLSGLVLCVVFGPNLFFRPVAAGCRRDGRAPAGGGVTDRVRVGSMGVWEEIRPKQPHIKL